MSTEDLGPKQWLRCNNCYILMRDSKVPFCLSFCSHIFCTKCVQIVTKKCPQCQTKNIRTMPLVEPLSPEVKHCFEPIENLHEQISQASAFQSQQWAINSKRTCTVEAKYNHAKKEFYRKSNIYKNTEKRCQEVEEEIKLLEQRFYDLEESHKHMLFVQNSSTTLTPNSLIGSLNSFHRSSSDCDNHSFLKRKSSNNSLSTPRNFNSEFRRPTMTKVPRSIRSCSKSSSYSSIGTPSSRK